MIDPTDERSRPDSTHVSIIKYVDRLWSAHADMHAVLSKDIDKSDRSLTERMTAANEIKQAMKDQQSNFVTREESNSQMNAIRHQVQMIERLVYIGLGIVFAVEVGLRFKP